MSSKEKEVIEKIRELIKKEGYGKAALIEAIVQCLESIAKRLKVLEEKVLGKT